MKDDEDVLAALGNQYGHTEARVAYVNEFEEAEQQHEKIIDVSSGCVYMATQPRLRFVVC